MFIDQVRNYLIGDIFVDEARAMLQPAARKISRSASSI